MAFTTLEMRALDESASAQLAGTETYEGLEAVAEMNVSGIAGSSEVVADYIRELQDCAQLCGFFRQLVDETPKRTFTTST